MTQDEIIEMAIQEGFYAHSKNFFDCTRKQIEAFAKLVASAAIAKEREGLVRMIEANILDERNACAELVESFGKYESDVADAIRARGQ